MTVGKEKKMSSNPELVQPEILTTVDFADVEDAWLLGDAIFEEWLNNWEAQFMEPVGEHMLLVFERAMKSMPKEILDMVEQMGPEAMAQFEELMALIKED